MGAEVALRTWENPRSWKKSLGKTHVQQSTEVKLIAHAGSSPVFSEVTLNTPTYKVVVQEFFLGFGQGFKGFKHHS